MIRIKRLVVRPHKPDVAAVILCGAELEVAIMQPDEHRGGAYRAGDRTAGGRRIDGDFLPYCPILVPPRGMGGAGKQDHGETAEDQLLQEVCLLLFDAYSHLVFFVGDFLKIRPHPEGQ